jgi:tRNA(His) 5'-end guanylyltransferase
MTPPDAATVLRGVSSRMLHDMMFSRGINLAQTPVWQRRGVLVYKKSRPVAGYNPHTQEQVETVRSVVVSDREIPVFGSPEGKMFISSLIGSF